MIFLMVGIAAILIVKHSDLFLTAGNRADEEEVTMVETEDAQDDEDIASKKASEEAATVETAEASTVGETKKETSETYPDAEHDDELGYTVIIPEEDVYIEWDMDYTIKEEVISVTNTETDGYTGFAIRYPQLVFKDGSKADKINQIIRDCACVQYDYMYPEVDRDSLPLYSEEYPYLSSEVYYQVTYASNDLICVAFTDHYFPGTVYYECRDFRTRVINVKTGETYEIEEILTHDSKLDQLYYDKLCENGQNLIEAKKFTSDIAGKTIDGESPEGRYFSNFILDADGVHLNLTFHYGDGNLILRGWSTAEFTQTELEKYQTESDLWQLFVR